MHDIRLCMRNIPLRLHALGCCFGYMRSIPGKYNYYSFFLSKNGLSSTRKCVRISYANEIDTNNMYMANASPIATGPNATYIPSACVVLTLGPWGLALGQGGGVALGP